MRSKENRSGAKKHCNPIMTTCFSLLLTLTTNPFTKLLHILCDRWKLTLQSHANIQASLYNSGITNTQVCAAFSFEIVKWLRKQHPKNIKLSFFEADDGHIRYILSAVMPKVESEILQDANTTWRSWLKQIIEKRRGYAGPTHCRF